MVLVIPAGPHGEHTGYPRSGDRHWKNPRSGESKWYLRQVPLSQVTLAQPLEVLAFSESGPPASAIPYVNRPSRDSFTFEVGGDGLVRFALVGPAEADQAVTTVTEQAATAPQLFRQYHPNVLMWTVASNATP